MSLHDDIQQSIRAGIDGLKDAGVKLSPSLLANQAYDQFGSATDEIHVRYGCIEHFKQIARGLLATKFDPNAERSESEAYQGDMFSGHLQRHYPIPVPAGQEPCYVPREALSERELDWNIDMLRKSGAARIKHADALRAYRDQRQSNPNAA